jgi:hypothetical protein
MSMIVDPEQPAGHHVAETVTCPSCGASAWLQATDEGNHRAHDIVFLCPNDCAPVLQDISALDEPAS